MCCADVRTGDGYQHCKVVVVVTRLNMNVGLKKYLLLCKMERAIKHLQRAEDIIANKSNNFGVLTFPNQSVEIPFNIRGLRIEIPRGNTAHKVNLSAQARIRAQYNEAVNTGAVQNVVTCIFRRLADNGCDKRENQNLVTFEWTAEQEARLIIGLSVNNPDLDGYDRRMYKCKMDELTKMKSIMKNAEDRTTTLLVRIVQECLSGSNNEYLRNLRINSHQVRLYAIGTGERVTGGELNARLQNLHNEFYYIPPRRLFPRHGTDIWHISDDFDNGWQRDTGYAGPI